jgi:predicted dehydrogenase
MEKIHWGILGTGDIAGKFAQALSTLPEAVLAAVGSRTKESAERFGAKWKIPRRHAGYAEMMEDPGVDVIYVATPHTLHRENCIGCLQAGKAVLCEKPFTINAREAEEVVAIAREKKLFLMEGMWTRFFPGMVRVRELLQQQAVGEVRMVQVDMAYPSKSDPRRRLLDPALGGGALLDLGVYPVSFSSMVYGPPEEVRAVAHFGSTGVDEQTSVLLSHAGGRQAYASCSFLYDSPKEAVISGTEGQIRIHRTWFFPERISLAVAGHSTRDFHLHYLDNGFPHEAMEVMDCLRSGRLESMIMPLNETLSIMRTLDTIRRQIGLRYPSEN